VVNSAPQEIRIIATGPCIANQLRDANTICRRSWYIAAHVWKIYDFKIEVVKTCYSEEQVISMLEFLIDNIFISIGGTLFQQVVSIPMGTICAPLLADLLSSLTNLLIFYKLLKKLRLI
jgi:hypothetical protein